jgi:hypothetical protein
MTELMKDEQRIHTEYQRGSSEAEEGKNVGEIAVRELIPRPTNDPNDPLVRVFLSNIVLWKANKGSELDQV